MDRYNLAHGEEVAAVFIYVPGEEEAIDAAMAGDDVTAAAGDPSPAGECAWAGIDRRSLKADRKFPCTPACAGAQCSNRAAVDLEPAPQAVGREAKEKRK